MLGSMSSLALELAIGTKLAIGTAEEPHPATGGSGLG